MRYKIVTVFLEINDGKPVLCVEFDPDMRDKLERSGKMVQVADALAQYGEQLRLYSLGLTPTEPALLFGPEGRPIAWK
jgi:hypothetical protein